MPLDGHLDMFHMLQLILLGKVSLPSWSLILTKFEATKLHRKSSLMPPVLEILPCHTVLLE